MDNDESMKALFIIVNVGFTDDVLKLARDLGVRGATILPARGESSHHESILGVTIDVEKDLVFCIVEDDVAGNVMAAIKEQAGINTPAHGVCFTLPVDKTVGIVKAPGGTPPGGTPPDETAPDEK